MTRDELIRRLGSLDGMRYSHGDRGQSIERGPYRHRKNPAPGYNTTEFRDKNRNGIDDREEDRGGREAMLRRLLGPASQGGKRSRSGVELL